jgi:hypothetical protein
MEECKGKLKSDKIYKLGTACCSGNLERKCKSFRLVVMHNAVGTKRDSRGYVYIDQDSGSTYNDPSYAVLHEEALLVL